MTRQLIAIALWMSMGSAFPGHAQTPTPQPVVTEESPSLPPEPQTYAPSQTQAEPPPPVSEPQLSAEPLAPEPLAQPEPTMVAPVEPVVRISELPALRVARDDLDFWLFGLTAALFISGAVLLVLLKKAIAQMTNAAEAARKSAETAAGALADARLPYLDTEIWHAVVERSQRGPMREQAAVRFAINNYGSTSAILEWVDLFWSIDTDPVEHRLLERRAPIGPHRHFIVDVCRADLRDDQVRAMQNDDGLVLRVWGRIHYRTAGADEQWWRTFGQFVILKHRQGTADAHAAFRPFDVAGFYREGRGKPDTRALEPPAAPLSEWDADTARKEREMLELRPVPSFNSPAGLPASAPETAIRRHA